MMITTAAIADAIADAPGWALVALTVPQERLRDEARREVAKHLYGALYRPDANSEQLTLPL